MKNSIREIWRGIQFQIDKFGLENKILYYLGIILVIYGGLKVVLDILLSILVALGFIVSLPFGVLGIIFNIYIGIRFIPGLVIGFISFIIIVGAGQSAIRNWNRFSKHESSRMWAKALLYLFVINTIFDILDGRLGLFGYIIKAIVVILYYYFANRQRNINDVLNWILKL